MSAQPSVVIFIPSRYTKMYSWFVRHLKLFSFRLVPSCISCYRWWAPIWASRSQTAVYPPSRVMDPTGSPLNFDSCCKQPVRCCEDEKKASSGYRTSLTKWEQDENLACAQIASLIGDLLLMKTHGCTTVVLMWQSLMTNLKWRPAQMYAVNCDVGGCKRGQRPVTPCALTWMRCDCLLGWYCEGDTTTMPLC